MPKIISDLPEHVLQRVRQLVDDSRYTSIDSFVRVAVENQLALESDDAVASVQARPATTPSAPANDFGFPFDRAFQFLQPASFDDLNVPGVENERDLWLWGQVNRILPLKFALRMLARHQPPDCNAIEYSEFIRSLVQEARQFGELLERQDKRLNKERGEGLAAAFPTGEDPQKAADRFGNLFVGSPRADGKQSGALPLLKFVRLLQEGDSISIGLTRAGVGLAELQNPAMDVGDYSQPLNTKEVEYYLGHILREVPGEVQAIKLILSAILSGKIRREAINEAISNVYPRWTPAMVNTQRTGAMSRMYELGLFSKEKIGVTVRYTLTPRGQEFLGR